jgi:hypothetical protein
VDFVEADDALEEPDVAAVAGDATPVGVSAPAPPVGVEVRWSAPSPGGRRPFEQWSVLALVAAAIGALPFTWPVPILSLLAVAFGFVGIRNCQLDRIWRNRWMAVLAVVIGVATLVTAMLLTALGRVQFLPFWTTA